MSSETISRSCKTVSIVLYGLFVFLCLSLHAQVDQGAVTGIALDKSGAVIVGAQVSLISVDTGLTLKATTNGSGEYTFSPVKLGNYKIIVSAAGFKTTERGNLHLDLQERLSVNVTLPIGSANEEVVVEAAPPLLQTQEDSVGQVITPVAIDHTPLNGRNWVYIAQLTPGVVAAPSGARGAGTGDFNASGMRAEQNDFILDGVDNNANVVDFQNGASYIVRPPPDALAEFKIQTADFSAEFGHSAGAVVNASVKSGTNDIHGSLWEYFRNDLFNASDYGAALKNEYRENQFGATLGLPVIKNRLFLFGDLENNRIIYAKTSTYTVPTAKMRIGDFSELLNTTLTGSQQAIVLYAPSSAGTTIQSCNGVENVFCPNQINAIAKKLISLFPLPNHGNGYTLNNYVVNQKNIDNTFQWDVRTDWNISSHDQTFARFSYMNEPQLLPAPFGSILDGSTVYNEGTIAQLGENFAASETHIFSPRVVNEVRFGYNYGSFGYHPQSAYSNASANEGLGGIPYNPSVGDGGLPLITFFPTSRIGTPSYLPSVEHENVAQLLDNVTFSFGNHSLRVGVDLQDVRFATLQPQYPHGNYGYTARSTSAGSRGFTGYALADFLTDNMQSANLSTENAFDDLRWYRAAYVQDDWRVTPRLTFNLGLRYDYFTPYRETAGRQANFIPTGPFAAGGGTGSGILEIPEQQRNAPLTPAFLAALAKDHIALQYVPNAYLATSQKTNLAPRIGFDYQVNSKTVIRGGFGLFYGGLENGGGGSNLGQNYPFQFTSSFTAASCRVGSCPPLSLTLETGFRDALAVGVQNFVSNVKLTGTQPHVKTDYSMVDNLTIERSITPNTALTIGYVGSFGKHIPVVTFPNSLTSLQKTGTGLQSVSPFPDFATGSQQFQLAGFSNYNSIQSKLEHRLSRGLNFLATYTYAHSLDDAPNNLESGLNIQDTNLIPLTYDYASSSFDVRHRVTVNLFYQLPFGAGRATSRGVKGIFSDGWATDLVFVAQTGQPFTVESTGSVAAGLAPPRAILIRNPFTPGGTPDPSNAGAICAQHTRTTQNWYNPCAFANVVNGTNITSSTPSDLATVISYFGGKRDQVYGPGYERINMSLFKSFATFHEQSLTFRTDIFNLLNTPAYNQPSIITTASNGGQITNTKFFQKLTPDSRFFQFSLKYQF